MLENVVPINILVALLSQAGYVKSSSYDINCWELEKCQKTDDVK